MTEIMGIRERRMHSHDYPFPFGLHVIPNDLLDLRPDDEVDHQLLHPPPVSHEKNVWFFWHTGYTRMHPYSQRNIRAWHRRFCKQGWVIRVLDRDPSSPLNIANFLDIADPANFPRAFTDNIVAGEWAPQHTSDLVRFPLLIRYGGIYADVGLMQIGDLDRLWRETVGNPDSPFEVFSYDTNIVTNQSLTNYFLASRPDNPLFKRCHRLLLALWAADGGKVDTEGMHRSSLLRGVPLMGGDSVTLERQGKRIELETAQGLLTDYVIQGQVTSMVVGLVDEEDGWNGPEYLAEHVYAIELLVGSMLINDLTAWDGRKAFQLMSLPLPRAGQEECEEQKQARKIVEACLQRSFGFKLAHGFITKTLGETLGTLWMKHEGSDNVPGTYAHWLRHGTMYWSQDEIPPAVKFDVTKPIKRGPLLEDSQG
ncbi:MAG: hypothetical protein L6R35_001534 [Caloplaca aegaea]|nr:MAG: hypothetical protein L6R35_001534 [Caloplaca aegaea]